MTVRAVAICAGNFKTAQYLRIEFQSAISLGDVQARLTNDWRGCGLPGAVVSYSFWHEPRGDAAVVGRELTLNYHRLLILGVTPPGFYGVETGRSYDVAVPICSQAGLWDEATGWMRTLFGG